MKKLSSIVLVLVSLFGFSQNYKGDLEPVPEDGFYKVFISPEVRSACKDNLDSFRIWDTNKKEVPYIYHTDSDDDYHITNQLEILKKSLIKDSISVYIIKNYNSTNNGQLVLEIANSEINKSFEISGSNDQKEWYGLVENKTIISSKNNKSISFTKEVNFPSNDYEFLKIEFNDKKSLPINILGIGHYQKGKKSKENSALKDFKYTISQDHKNQKTIITFTSDTYQKVDGISFTINNKIYNRSAKLFLNKSRLVKKRSEYFQQEIADFLLNSNTSNNFEFEGFLENEFTIEIDNYDDQPLVISKIEVLQNALFMITKLKKDDKYEVIIDTTLTQPKYDLAFFIKEFKNEQSEIKIINFKKVENLKIQAYEKPFWQTQMFMWICIFLGGGVVAYFAFGLLKEMKNE